MKFFSKIARKISDTIFSESNRVYRFLPHCFILGALTELFMIKAPLAGKGETFYDVVRRKESERRFQKIFNKSPEELQSEDSNSISVNKDITPEAVSDKKVV